MCVAVFFMFQFMHAFFEVFTVVWFCFRESKFGTHGELAEEFAELVSQLWLNQYRSIVPRDFKVGHVQVTFKCRRFCTVHVFKFHGDVMLVVLSGKTSRVVCWLRTTRLTRVSSHPARQSSWRLKQGTLSYYTNQLLLILNWPEVRPVCRQVRNRPKLPEQKNDGVADEKAALNAWHQHKTVHDSIMVELFQVCMQLPCLP